MTVALQRALLTATDAGRQAAAADRDSGTRSRPLTSSTSDSQTARKLAVAWWRGYAEVWPEALQALDDIDRTGISAEQQALDAEPVSDEDLHWSLPHL